MRIDNFAGYSTHYGHCICGDSINLLQLVSDNSVNLVITSPPFALQRKKEYGNEEQGQYANWLCEFGRLVYRKLQPDGSFVVDIGGAYEKGQPSYSLYQFKTLIKLCEEVGFYLAQPFYWHNPSALPTPIEWVNKKKQRAKTSVNTIWWLSKTPYCKADVTKVLTPYSSRMHKLISNPDEFLKTENTVRPSGHILGKSTWTNNNGGAIPSNMLQIPNTESNSQYLRLCKSLNVKSHPSRFPSGLPEFFIKMLTTEGDLIIDIFSGSNTTGQVSEKLKRRWLGFDVTIAYVAASAFRFCDSLDLAKQIYSDINNGKHITIGDSHSLIVNQ